jgi:hypothetical protein
VRESALPGPSTMVAMCAGELTVTHSESREDRELPQHSSCDLRQRVHVIHKDNENVRRDYSYGAGNQPTRTYEFVVLVDDVYESEDYVMIGQSF